MSPIATLAQLAPTAVQLPVSAYFDQALFELEKRIDISLYDIYNASVFGFISERLLDVWLETNKLLYVEQNVCCMEKQNWLVKGGKFLKRKLLG